MSPNNLYFLGALAVFLVALATVFLVYSRRIKKQSDVTWEDLLRRLKPFDRSSVELIALDIVDESGHPRPGQGDGLLDPEEIWPLIGGLEGLEAMKQNCAVLVELAFYVQKWHPEALVVAERLRLNAREIEWHLERLRGASETGNLASAFPSYAQRAIATYYLMTKSVLGLYELGNMPQLGELQRAI